MSDKEQEKEYDLNERAIKKSRLSQIPVSMDRQDAQSTSNSSTITTASSSSSATADFSTLDKSQRVSIYVDAFEEMIDEVLKYEAFLFTNSETIFMQRWKQLDYESRYLFVRLFLRKPGWFRVNDIPYHDEISDPIKACSNLTQVMSDLSDQVNKDVQQDVQHEKSQTQSQTQTQQDADLSNSLPDSDQLNALNDFLDQYAILEQSTTPYLAHDANQNLDRFALDQTDLQKSGDLDEMLSLLNVNKLKNLCIKLKIANFGTTRESMIRALKGTSNKQTTLFGNLFQGKRELGLKFDSRGNKTMQSYLLIENVIKDLGPCIKLSPNCVSLFSRVHLIFHRTSYLTERALVSSVLARMKLRTYPSYQVKRSFCIFESRSQLVLYEQALRSERLMLELVGEVEANNLVKRFPDREKRYDLALELFELVWPIWQQIISNQDLIELSITNTRIEADDDDDVKYSDQCSSDRDKLFYYRKRFHPGWPFTRVVYKSCSILGRRQQYYREHQVLESLLHQTHFRRGKRGSWYDRLALILMNHFSDNKDSRRREALSVCLKGIDDPFTHLIFYDTLKRRVSRLEKALQIDIDKRHNYQSTLRKANKNKFFGERINEKTIGQKSVWRGLDGSHISVEELCLEWYVRQGWKGYHSENGIVTTIFSLLFYDVLFAPIDGAFETSYQNAPLDLATDAFSIARADLIDSRLQEIKEEKGIEILERVYDSEFENKTWIVGVRWEYPKQDLTDIVKFIGGKALSVICRVFAEEWGHRVGGIPDLCIWHSEKQICRFVEVKGPGDSLSETQKVWVDLLLSANVDVEICHVVESQEEIVILDDDD